MSFSNHADSFYAGYKRERVLASKPNSAGTSYRQPDRQRVSDVVLSGLGDDPAASTAAAVTSTTTPGTPTVVAPLTLMDALKANKLMALGAIAVLLVLAGKMAR